MLPRVTRRRFFETAAATGLVWPLLEHAAPAPFAAPAVYPVHFRKVAPWDSLSPYIEPGKDEFLIEKQVAEITAHLNRLLELGDLPLSPEFRGTSPMPVRHAQVADGVFRAEFNPADGGFRPGLQYWVRSLGQVRSARFFVLPQGRVRY